ncbi:MAG: SUF system NifU family Fe-S cluster assembly protein [Chloroflexi bacterium]|nr:SUF system NifU family Fe-S cluster assembly protein [Chloroflexota bacterium]MDA1219251.1 SUF system NifU family Fe-S cluster assembly protein [Chloroflexota bacterium]PKB57829.1 MAG: SUF system NifU family Fe-S cluster assembly protein [SAR202 cluster bacterium Casp-Chloro-G3]
MSDLTDLYQEILLEHNSKPRNYRKLDDATNSAEGFNPLCGDQYTLYLKLDGDIIQDIGFQGTGCAISKASASMLTQQIKGMTVEQAESLFNEVHKMLTESGAEVDSDLLDELETLSGVSAYPTRIKCAILVWHTLLAALEGKQEVVATE